MTSGDKDKIVLGLIGTLIAKLSPARKDLAQAIGYVVGQELANGEYPDETEKDATTYKHTREQLAACREFERATLAKMHADCVWHYR